MEIKIKSRNTFCEVLGFLVQGFLEVQNTWMLKYHVDSLLPKISYLHISKNMKAYFFQNYVHIMILKLEIKKFYLLVPFKYYRVTTIWLQTKFAKDQ